MSAQHNQPQASKRTKKGTVTSISGHKSIVVTVHRYRKHPVLGKRYRISKKFHAHDEHCTAKLGDSVEIAESRPTSRLKRWVLVSPSTS